MSLKVPIGVIGKKALAEHTIQKYVELIKQSPELTKLLKEYGEKHTFVKIQPFRAFLRKKRQEESISRAFALKYKREAALILKAAARVQF